MSSSSSRLQRPHDHAAPGASVCSVPPLTPRKRLAKRTAQRSWTLFHQNHKGRHDARGHRRRTLRAGSVPNAIHLRSLLEFEFMQRALLGVLKTVKPEAIHAAVRRAVDVFVAGYQRR